MVIAIEPLTLTPAAGAGGAALVGDGGRVVKEEEEETADDESNEAVSPCGSVAAAGTGTGG